MHKYWLILILGIMWMPAAQAHKLKIFASAEGNVIIGYVYFPGGMRLANKPVNIFTTDGKKLGEIMTNSEGEFRYSVIHQTDHLFVVETEDGHRARYSVAVAELGGVNHEESTPRFDSSVTTPVMAQAELSTCLPATLEPFMAQIVSKQLRPLREQLEVYQETVRWHDILGGIGYIFGIMGLWSYFAARRAAKNLPGL